MPTLLMPRVTDDITRRRLLAASGGVALSPWLLSCGAGDSAVATAETRTVDSARGPVEVPVAPQRVAAMLDAGVTLNLLDIGAPVIASTGEGGRIRIDNHDVSDIDFLGSADTPDLERLAAAAPDLIVALTFQEDFVQQFAAIAPTVVLDYGPDVPLLDYERRLADVVGLLPMFEEQQARLAERTAQLRSALTPVASSLEVSVFSVEPDGLFTITGPGIAWTFALEQLGLATAGATPASFDTGNAGYLSQERLPEFDGDVVFLMDGVDNDEELSQLQGSPLFATLNAAQKDQVHSVPYDTWTASRISAVLSVYDDLQRHIVDQEIDTTGNFR